MGLTSAFFKKVFLVKPLGLFVHGVCHKPKVIPLDVFILGGI